MTVRLHTLVLCDRGVEHVHRWVATCSCGWAAPQRRRKQDAVELHRAHKRGWPTEALQ